MAVEKKAIKQNELIVANIQQTTVDRSKRTIGDYVTAVQSAESVHYPARAALYDLYTRVSIDGTFIGSWELKRITKVLSKVIKFRAGDKEVEEVNNLIESKAFRDFIRVRMMQKAWGVQGVQFVTGPEFKFVEIPVKHINPAIKKITKWQIGEEGWNYEDDNSIMIFGDKDDYGFLLAITPLILYKQGNWGDWADFIEKYGSPFQIYEYDIYDDKTRQEAFNLAKNAGSNLAIVLPKQLQFRTEDGKQVNGDGSLQNKFNDALDKQITLSILGNLETTSAGGGSLAKAKVQSLDQNDVIAMDLKDVMDTLNSAHFMSILESYGYPIKNGRVEFEMIADPEVLKSEVEIDRFLVNEAKLPLADDYFYDKYRRPKPDNYDELKAKQEEGAKLFIEQPDEPEPDNQKSNISNQKSNISNPKSNISNPKSNISNLKSNISNPKLSFWDKIDLRIANFFDPGHKG